MPYAQLPGPRLYYERAGDGGPELLFVHGWCCDHTAFRPQFEHFAQTCKVTALDLRGCGRSDRPTDGYSVPELAEDIALFCAEVGIERPVVAGHSHGGLIGVELAARHPDVPRAVVLVDPGPIVPPPERRAFFRTFADEMEGPDGADVRRRYVEDMGARDEQLARWIVDLMCRVPLPVAAAVVREMVEWDGPAAFACAVPTLLLRAELRDEPDALRLREIKPDLAIGVTVGAGHFHQLEVPEQVNAMIERFLALA